MTRHETEVYNRRALEAVRRANADRETLGLEWDAREQDKFMQGLPAEGYQRPLEDYIREVAAEEGQLPAKERKRRPWIRIEAPTSGDTVRGRVEVFFRAFAPEGLMEVSLLVDGALHKKQYWSVATREEIPGTYFGWDTLLFEDGEHTLNVEAVCARNITFRGRQPVIVEVDNRGG